MKRCTVACDTPSGIRQCELSLPDEATIEAAVAQAAVQLGAAGESQVDWQHAPTGIYGKVRARSYIWADGDRIELYRALQLDPRARRRERAAPHRGKPKRGALER